MWRGGCGCFLIMAGLGAALGGAQGLYIVSRNQEPVEISCAEAYVAGISREWVRLTDAYLHYSEAMEFFSTTGSSDSPVDVEYAIPIAPSPGFDGSYKFIVLAGRNTPRGIKVRARTTPAVEHVPTLEGLALVGLDAKDSELAMLREASNVAADATLIEEGAEPELGVSIMLLSLGALLLGIPVLRWRRKRKKDPVPWDDGDWSSEDPDEAVTST